MELDVSQVLRTTTFLRSTLLSQVSRLPPSLLLTINRIRRVELRGSEMEGENFEVTEHVGRIALHSTVEPARPVGAAGSQCLRTWDRVAKCGE
jgi:hypothetical protein